MMQQMTSSASDGTICLRTIAAFNWAILATMAIAGWLAFSPRFGIGVVIGGVIANVSFLLLRRDLTNVLAGPLKAAKARFFIKYYARFAVLTVILFFLIQGGGVNLFGLLLGLSTVALSIGATAIREIKKIYLMNAREAT